jgi:hypothetical protein
MQVFQSEKAARERLAKVQPRYKNRRLMVLHRYFGDAERYIIAYAKTSMRGKFIAIP